MAEYDYGNTRLRARMSSLFDMDTLASLADVTSIDGLITMLAQTPYRESIEYAITFAHGHRCVTQALQRETALIYQDMARFYTGEAHEKIRLIFVRDDLKNIKAILRGLSHHNPFDEITASFSTLGTTPVGILVQIAKSSNVDEAISKMAVYGLPMAQPLLELIAEQGIPSVAVMENWIEQWYFQQTARLISGSGEDLRLLREYHQIEADIINLNTVLRFIIAPQAEEELPGQVEDYLIPYGSLPLEHWQALAHCPSLEELMNQLFSTRYKHDLQMGMDCYKNTGKLSEFEANMRAFLLKWLARLPRLFPLGIGVPLGYIARKLSEIRNLYWIAKGVASGFEASYIKENLEILA